MGLDELHKPNREDCVPLSQLWGCWLSTAPTCAWLHAPVLPAGTRGCAVGATYRKSTTIKNYNLRTE